MDTLDTSLLGYYLHSNDLKEKTKKLVYLLAVISVISTIIITSILSLKSGVPNEGLYGYLLPNTFFVSAAVFILFKEKASQIEFKESTSTKIFLLSNLTFGMYLVHDFFNMVFLKIGFTSILFNPLFSVPLITLVEFAGCFVVIFIISKIPFLNKHIL